VPFGFRLGESGELVPHEAEQEAIREIVALRAQGKTLRAIADAVRAKGHRISHEGVAGVLRVAANAPAIDSPVSVCSSDMFGRAGR
jgi:putative DNA-invertase from lambdoid prophage Rac